MTAFKVCSGVPGEPVCGKLIPSGSRSTGYKCRECANEYRDASELGVARQPSVVSVPSTSV
jgi:tRNA(Ile2) C34 agmatinyltransferase TiaS